MAEIDFSKIVMLPTTFSMVVTADVTAYRQYTTIQIEVRTEDVADVLYRINNALPIIFHKKYTDHGTKKLTEGN